MRYLVCMACTIHVHQVLILVYVVRGRSQIDESHYEPIAKIGTTTRMDRECHGPSGANKLIKHSRSVVTA